MPPHIIIANDAHVVHHLPHPQMLRMPKVGLEHLAPVIQHRLEHFRRIGSRRQRRQRTVAAIPGAVAAKPLGDHLLGHHRPNGRRQNGHGLSYLAVAVGIRS